MINNDILTRLRTALKAPSGENWPEFAQTQVLCGDLTELINCYEATTHKYLTDTDQFYQINDPSELS
jgi:hypothetical protein